MLQRRHSWFILILLHGIMTVQMFPAGLTRLAVSRKSHRVLSVLILIIFNIQELMELHIIQPRKFLLLWDGCLVRVQTMRLVVSAQPLSRVERSSVQVRMQMAQPTSSTIVVR